MEQKFLIALTILGCIIGLIGVILSQYFLTVIAVAFIVVVLVFFGNKNQEPEKKDGVSGKKDEH